ncbi:MAG: hypothetical protein H6698_08315 [Myxococcales bacterium]|nr:hypothetical protein [Myxococcales bacterium]
MSRTAPKHARSAAALGPLAALVCACGSLGGDGGGGENLPNRGVIPFNYQTVVEGSGEPEPDPYVILDPDRAELGEPFADLVGDGVRLWVERRSRDGDELGVFESPDGRTFDGAYAPQLTAAAFAELSGVDAADIGAPSVFHTTAGETWLALDWNDDDGVAVLRLEPAPVAVVALVSAADRGVDGLSSPSIAASPAGDGLVLFATAVRDGGDPIIVVAALSSDGVGPLADAVPSGVPCVDAEGAEVACWDADGAGAPDVRLARTAAGRRYLRMFFAGGSDLDEALGFAASFDGVTWDRYPYNPTFDDGRTKTLAPSVVRIGDAWLMYLERRTARVGGIALAINDKPWMADDLVE